MQPRSTKEKEGKGGKKLGKKPRKNQPGFDLRAELHRILGVDLTRIDGIDVMTAQVILTELGPDLSGFPSEGDFSSWLELAPRNDITGGKTIRKKARKSKNRVANALRDQRRRLSAAAIPIWERVTGNSGDGWRANRRSRLWRVTWRAWSIGC